MVSAGARQEDRHSGSIIGRYEHAEMTPSVEVARKIANAFQVTLDFLVSDNARRAPEPRRARRKSETRPTH